MNKILELLARSFNLWTKKRWLKAVDREYERASKLKRKYNRQRYIADAMLSRYNELYEDMLGVPKELK